VLVVALPAVPPSVLVVIPVMIAIIVAFARFATTIIVAVMLASRLDDATRS
jgi:hypothetical protein